MELASRRCWQVSAGDGDRNYVAVDLDWDVILMGDGWYGPWPQAEPAMAAGSTTARKLSIVRRFCEEMAEGDIVVLRMGTKEIHAVGEVVGPYAWYEDFGDIDGWDLQHVRRVRWLWRAGAQPKQFDTYTLKLGDSVQRLTSEGVFDWLKGLEVSAEAAGRPVVPLPASCVHGQRSSEMQPQQIGEHLFDNGVDAAAVDSLLSQVDDLVRIAGWYVRASVDPSEHETVAYLVVPILRALGWTPQRAALEWRNIDLALFDRLPREQGTLSAVVEAKRRHQACLSARSQAQGYADTLGTAACHRLVVTDGIRYGVYVRSANGFPEYPSAYLNLLRMRRCYPILRCEGAAAALLMMSAGWSPLTEQRS